MSDRTTDERAGDVADTVNNILLDANVGLSIRAEVAEAIRAAHGPGRCELIARHAFAINCCSRGIENIVHLALPAVEGAAERPQHISTCLKWVGQEFAHPLWGSCSCACHDWSAAVTPGAHAFERCRGSYMTCVDAPLGDHQKCHAPSCGEVESAAVHQG